MNTLPYLLAQAVDEGKPGLWKFLLGGIVLLVLLAVLLFSKRGSFQELTTATKKYSRSCFRLRTVVASRVFPSNSFTGTTPTGMLVQGIPSGGEQDAVLAVSVAIGGDPSSRRRSMLRPLRLSS